MRLWLQRGTNENAPYKCYKNHKQSHKYNCVLCWREILSCRGIAIAFLSWAVIIPEQFCSSSDPWSLLHKWCGAGEKGIGQIQYHSGSASGVGYIPTLLPCLRDEEGPPGASLGGSRCAWAEDNSVRTRAQCLQEQDCNVLHPVQGK